MQHTLTAIVTAITLLSSLPASAAFPRFAPADGGAVLRLWPPS